MDSKNESLISETTATEQVRTEQREAPTSSNVLPFQDKTDKEKNQSKISDKKTVTEENSLVSMAKSSSTIDNKMESQAVSSAGSLSSTLEVKEKEVLCRGGDTVASSGSSTPHSRPETAFEGTKEEASKSIASSRSLITSAKEAKNTVKATEQGTNSTAVVPSFPTAAAAEKERDCEQVADSASNSPVEIKMVDSPRVISSQKIALSGHSEEAEAGTSSKSEVLSLKTLPSQKKIPEVYRFDSATKDEINASNDFQGTFLVAATSGLSVIGADSENTTECENRETENEVTATPNTGEQEAEEDCEDNERKAFFYISSCSVPGMGEGSEWPSVSDGYQMPIARPERRIAPQQSREPRRCLGTQRCHYVIAVIAFLTAFIGCIAYHMSNSGKGPDILKPIGASTAFLSFAVCVFSAVYINYLRNYPGLPIVPNYELLGDVDSVMAMNRASDPEFYYADDRTYVSRDRTAASEYYFRETQSADVLDRRGYGSLQTDSKRCPDDSGTLYSTQPPKKFKASQSSIGQGVEESNGGQGSSGPHACEGIEPDSRSSDAYRDSVYSNTAATRKDD